jgi:hypothetical protein
LLDDDPAMAGGRGFKLPAGKMRSLR